jgi:hypothetical protein
MIYIQKEQEEQVNKWKILIFLSYIFLNFLMKYFFQNNNSYVNFNFSMKYFFQNDNSHVNFNIMH